MSLEPFFCHALIIQVHMSHVKKALCKSHNTKSSAVSKSNNFAVLANGFFKLRTNCSLHDDNFNISDDDETCKRLKARISKLEFGQDKVLVVQSSFHPIN